MRAAESPVGELESLSHAPDHQVSPDEYYKHAMDLARNDLKAQWPSMAGDKLLHDALTGDDAEDFEALSGAANGDAEEAAVADEQETLTDEETRVLLGREEDL
jgi:hypothetical protein